MFIINAPLIFTTIWSGIKLIIDKNTQDKIKILGTDYKEKLLEHVIIYNNRLVLISYLYF